MPKYHFHLRHGAYLFEDERGAVLPDHDAARVSALIAAQDLIAEHPCHDDWTACAFEVTDKAGRQVLRLPVAWAAMGDQDGTMAISA